MRGVPGTFGIFAAFSCQTKGKRRHSPDIRCVFMLYMKIKTKKILPFKRGVPGAMPYDKSGLIV